MLCPKCATEMIVTRLISGMGVEFRRRVCPKCQRVLVTEEKEMDATLKNILWAYARSIEGKSSVHSRVRSLVR